MVRIYNEIESPNRGRGAEPEWQHEGACLRYMMMSRMFKKYDEAELPKQVHV